MALGFTGGSAEIEDYIKYDARSGRFFMAQRQPSGGGDGMETVNSEMTLPFQVVMDLERVEVGWLSYTDKGPMHKLVNVGQPMPPIPEDVDKFGKPLFKQGFRVRLGMPKDLGGGVRSFSANAACVRTSMDALHDEYLAAPQSREGKLPVVNVSGIIKVESSMSVNYRPRWDIVAWVARPASLGGNGVDHSAGAPKAPQRASAPPQTGNTRVTPPPPPPPPPPSAPSPLAADDFG